MKKISIVFIAAATLLAAGCTKNASDELNVNPKNPATGIGTALFLQAELDMMNTYNTTDIGVAPFRVLSQEWNENSYEYESQYNLDFYNSPGNFWGNTYVGSIHAFNQAKQSFPVGYAGAPGVLRNELIISDVLTIYSYYMLVATYGNIPYSESENVAIPFPKFDDAKTVYADLLTRIDTCIAGLDVTQGAMGEADQIYGGSTIEWMKFSASLKLKMALLNAKNDPATTKTKVTEAIATGVFTSNADNALFSYDPSSVVNSSPIWNAFVFSGRHDFGPGGLLVNTMNGWNDPRLPLYFTQYNGAYVGGIAGNAGNSFGGYSDFCCNINGSLSMLYSASYPGDLLDYAEVEFYLAEAAAQGFTADPPATHYNNAITASIEFWGGAAADAATYLAQPTVAYATATGTWQQIIGYQEFIANYNRNWDSWTAERRLGYPNINVVSPPQGANGPFPLRFTYPPNETTSNPANTAAAVAALPGGVDLLSAALFWE